MFLVGIPCCFVFGRKGETFVSIVSYRWRLLLWSLVSCVVHVRCWLVTECTIVILFALHDKHNSVMIPAGCVRWIACAHTHSRCRAPWRCWPRTTNSISASHRPPTATHKHIPKYSHFYESIKANQQEQQTNSIPKASSHPPNCPADSCHNNALRITTI